MFTEAYKHIKKIFRTHARNIYLFYFCSTKNKCKKDQKKVTFHGQNEPSNLPDFKI